MSVPAQRKSSSRTKRGRSHQALKASNLSTCKACNGPVKSHEACRSCGQYDGRSVSA